MLGKRSSANILAENILRVQPPLVITEEEATRAMDIIEKTIEEYMNGKISNEALEVVQGW